MYAFSTFNRDGLNIFIMISSFFKDISHLTSELIDLNFTIFADE